MKIDLQKAIDFVQWGFPHELLICLIFCQVFVHWMTSSDLK